MMILFRRRILWNRDTLIVNIHSPNFPGRLAWFGQFSSITVARTQDTPVHCTTTTIVLLFHWALGAFHVQPTMAC